MKIKTQLNESGQGMSEYLILVMLIAVASIAATRGVGKTVYNKLNQIHQSVEGVTIESVQGKDAESNPSSSSGQGSNGASSAGARPGTGVFGSALPF